MIISRIRGDTYPIELQVRRSSDRSMADITGSILTMSVSGDRSPDASDYEFQVIGTITDSQNGKVEFPISTLSASTLKGRYHFDVQILSAGEVRTITRGTITFRESITK